VLYSTVDLQMEALVAGSGIVGDGDDSGAELEALAHRMQADVRLVRTRRHNLRTYRNSVPGADAVSWLLRAHPSQGAAPAKQVCATRGEAVALCERMLYRGLLHRVSFEHGFVDGGLFDRFAMAPELAARALRRSNVHAQ
jgi:hypothetical protein